MQVSSNARLYYFACEFLWSALALSEYLMDAVNSPKIGTLFTRLKRPINDLAGCVLDARYFLVDIEEPSRSNREKLFVVADRSRESLMARWSDEIQRAATFATETHPEIDRITWLYYAYCAFLRQVLESFEDVVRGFNESAEFDQNHKEVVRLCSVVRDICRMESYTAGRQVESGGPVVDKLLIELDTLAKRQSMQWHQAVASAAREPG